MTEIGPESGEAVSIIIAAWHDAWYRGRADAIAEMKHDQHALVRALRTRQTLWMVRGEKRTRETYGQPHPQDYTGGPVPAW